MLRAYARVLEHVTLAGDLVIVVGCWPAYVVRFRGSAAPVADIALWGHTRHDPAHRGRLGPSFRA
jgi:hypothetical protein